eukprot:gnl/Chilomastix_caulleri/1072.p2 GENE.gnl/Chilomastix_caulleri/1072~~gnl/Chilomastix_caulleri/1072.p2  ORF type:complete len:105 (+),score=46.69 gnl/Chilomastix_caulleri/1072:167-481(+)
MMMSSSPSANSSPIDSKESQPAGMEAHGEAMSTTTTQGMGMGTEGGGSAQAMAEPSREELMDKYKQQIDSLHSMGFFDDERSLKLLRLTGGDVNATVDRLLTDM